MDEIPKENLAKKEERPSYVGRFQVCCKRGVGEFNGARSILLTLPTNIIHQSNLSMYNVTVYSVSTYFGVSTTIAQLFAISQNISNTGFCIFGSVFANKLTPRRLLIIFMLINAALNFILPWGSFWYCLVIKLFANFCFSIIGPTANPGLKLMTIPEKYRSTMSRFTSLQCIGGILAPLLAGVFCDLPFSWKAIPLFLGSALLVTALLYLFCYPKISYIAPKPEETTGERKQKEKRSMTKNPSFDLIGSLLFVLFIIPLSVVLISSSILPWYLIVVFVVICLASFVAYVLFERQLESGQIIPFGLLKNKKLVLCLALYFLCIVTFRLPMILTPLVIQQAYGLNSTISGFVNAFTLPVGQLVAGLVLPSLMKKMKMHLILTICLFLTGFFGILLCCFYLLDSPIPLIVTQLFYSLFVSGAIILISVNLMNYSPRNLLAVTGCLQEVVGQFGAVFGQFIAVTIRDILIPIFNDYTNPLSNNGIRMGSLISGVVISAFCLLGSIIAPKTKADEGYRKAPIAENAEIQINEKNIIDVQEEFAEVIEGEIFPSDESNSHVL